MERTARVIRCVLCAVLATALALSATAAAAAATKKPRHPRRVTCVVHVKRLGNKSGRKLRRVVRCTKPKAKRRAKIALKGRGQRTTTAKGSKPSTKSKPSSTTTTTTSTTTSGSQSPAVQGSLLVGLDASVVHWTYMNPRLDQIESQTGAKWMRQDFFWSDIEPQRGVFDFSLYDQYVLDSAQHGIHLLPLLFDTPSWAGASDSAIPTDPTDYATYVAAVVHRYGPHGTFWTEHPTLATYAIQTYELWNEPYYDNGNNGTYDPARYAHLIKAASIAGRTADPTAKFLIAAENQAQNVNGTWVWWIDALYQAVPDLNNYFDGVAVHPYGTDLTSLSFPTPGQAYDGYSQLRRVEAIRQEFVNHGATDKPLWITEIGWPTCTSGSTRCTTPTGQANNLQTVFNYAHTTWKNYVQAVFVYSYDDSSPDPTDPEHDYGLAYNNGTPKPALTTFKNNATRA